jgi:ubiquinol-cytochrome c reductase cytochrome c1 subunit
VLGATAAASGLGLWYALEKASQADLELHPPSYPWFHSGFFNSFDMRSVRRGYHVYKQVCAACHAIPNRPYFTFIDHFMSEEEAKAEAAEATIQDGPDEEGNMFERPRKITDDLPQPYRNSAEAKAANNGAAPPDLSLITLARGEQGGENYIFSILTGYEDPPAGVEVGEGQAYNPYFLGGVLSMAQQLYDEGLEYEDGTPATVSQQAKDVTTFLHFLSTMYEQTQWKYIRACALVAFPLFTVGLFGLFKLYVTPDKAMKIFFMRLPYKGGPTVRQMGHRPLTPYEVSMKEK